MRRLVYQPTPPPRSGDAFPRAADVAAGGLFAHELVVRAALDPAARDAIAGGRLSDSHIAEVARASGAPVVVTDNRRHFVTALRYDLRVETPTEFLANLKGRKVSG